MKGSWHGGGHGHWLSSTDVMSNATAMEVNFFFFCRASILMRLSVVSVVTLDIC